MLQSYVPVSQAPSLASEQGKRFALPWVEDLVLQSEDLNADHQVLFELLNDLLFALSCSDLDRISPACERLATEAGTHFSKEETLMRTVDYPDSADHLQRHHELLLGIEHIRFALTAGLISWSPASAITMLEKWFVPHLTLTDRKLADFVAQRDVTALS